VSQTEHCDEPQSDEHLDSRIVYLRSCIEQGYRPTVCNFWLEILVVSATRVEYQPFLPDPIRAQSRRKDAEQSQSTQSNPYVSELISGVSGPAGRIFSALSQVRRNHNLEKHYRTNRSFAISFGKQAQTASWAPGLPSATGYGRCTDRLVEPIGLSG
jgi:hypothetical protein